VNRLKIGTGVKRGFETFKWKANRSPSEITRWESFWHVRSTFKQDALLRFLRLRYFWGLMSDLEIELAFDHPRFLNDVEFNVLLTVLASTELTKLQITERSESALKFIGKTSKFSKRLIPQWNNNIYVLAEREQRTIRPHKAFSGWVRNASSIGSKHKSTLNIPEPILEEFTKEQFNEYKYLYESISVGKIETNLGFISLP